MKDKKADRTDEGNNKGGIVKTAVISVSVLLVLIVLFLMLANNMTWGSLNFSGEEKKAVAYSSIDFTPEDLQSKAAGLYVKNIVLDEKNGFGKWAKRRSGYLFKYNGEKNAKIELYFTPLERYSRKDILLKFYTNGTLAQEYAVEGGDGIKFVDVPLVDINGKTLTIIIESNASLGAKTTDTEGSVFVRKISLQG